MVSRIGFWVLIFICVWGVAASTGFALVNPTDQGSGVSGGASVGSGLGEISVPTVTITTNSPVPLAGVLNFSTACGQSWNRLVVCRGNVTCTSASPTLLCQSPLASTGSSVCSYPTNPLDLGSINYSGACCNQANACTPTEAGTALVGIAPKFILKSLQISSEISRTHVIRKDGGTIIAAVLVRGSYSLQVTNDNGNTWNAIPLAQLVLPNSIPANEGGFTVTEIDLDSAPNRDVGAVFTIVGNTSRHSSIFYTECSAATNCIAPANWSTPRYVINPILTTTQSAPFLYVHDFSHPDLVITSTGTRNVILYDALQLPPKIPGVFHYYCLSNCGAPSAVWKNPNSGADITGGNSVNAMDLHLAFTSNNRLHAVWKDQGNWLYAVYNPASDQWSSLGGGTALGFVDAALQSNSFELKSGGNVLYILAASDLGNQKNLRLFRCTQPICTNQVDWTPVSGKLDGFRSDSIPFFGLIPSWFDGKFLIVAQTVTNAVASIEGYNSNSDAITDIADSSLGSNPQLDSVSPQAQAGQADWLVLHNDNWYAYSSTALNSSPDNPPQLVLMSVSPSPWTIPPGQPSNGATVSKTITFRVSDSDDTAVSSEGLYASIGLGTTSNAITVPFFDEVDLHDAQSGLVPNLTCTGQGTGFASTQTCTATLTLLSPSTQLLLQNGNYFPIVQVHDTRGGANKVSGNAVNVSLSNSTLLVIQPVTGSIYRQATAPNVVSAVITNPSFAQFLRLGVFPAADISNPYLTYSISEYGPVNPAVCSYDSALNLYSCAFPINNAIIPEGKYDFDFRLQEDGIVNRDVCAMQVTLDVVGPHLTASAPTGVIPSVPTSGTFSLMDYSKTNLVSAVRLNGTPTQFSCTPNGNGMDCTYSLAAANNTPSSSNAISIDSTDLLGNTSTSAFAFSLAAGNNNNGGTGGGGPGGGGPGGGGGGGGGGDGGDGGGFSGGGGPSNPITRGTQIVQTNDQGDIKIAGTPIVIPRTIVESVRRFSRGVRSMANDIVEITGPSATAIFIGICALAGIASDSVYRVMFNRIKSTDERRKEWIIRAALAGVMAFIPLGIGLGAGLQLGLIFVVIEFVGFALAWYVVHYLQRARAFGFVPVMAAASASPSSPGKASIFSGLDFLHQKPSPPKDTGGFKPESPAATPSSDTTSSESPQTSADPNPKP